jgi:voltage-gated potassium channel Kch
VIHPAVRWSQRAWASDLGLTVLTGFTLVVVFVLEPLADRVRQVIWILLAFEIVFALVMISALLAVTRRVWVGLLGAAFAVVLFAVKVASLVDPALVILDRTLAIVPAFLLMLIVLTLSLRAGPVNYHRIAGAVLTYLLLAMLWARAYDLLIHLLPGAIVLTTGGGAAAVDREALTYFSVMTMTTAGYGDMVPVHPVARTLASLEAIVGVMFPVVYLSRFVSAMQTGKGSER